MAISEEEKQALEQQKLEQENNLDKQVIKVVTNNNDVFEKHYKLAEQGLDFTIRLKVPSLLDTAKINAQVERWFDGMASLMTPQTLMGYRVLATIKLQQNKYKDEPGTIEIPDFLKNTDKIYNLYPLMIIGKDFAEFLDTFQY